jgi:[ribosomal protein S5]-alanine N-acetyltransferase
MNIPFLKIEKLVTDRLILIPYTYDICKKFIVYDFSDLGRLGLKKGNGWPDEDVIDTLPRILNNLSKVESPSGFESWMIIKKHGLEIIGDAGFKGFNVENENIDIGYGIIELERRNGYASEAIKALIDWAFSNYIIKDITASCLIDNTSSINILRKFNFIEIKKEDKMLYWVLKRSLF